MPSTLLPFLIYALAILLGLALDITGVLHVYGLDWLMGQNLATGTGLWYVVLAVGWVFVAFHTPPVPPPPTPPAPAADVPLPARQWGRRGLVLLMLLAWLATWRDVAVFLSPNPSPGFWSTLVGGGGAVVLVAALVRPPPPGALLVGAVVGGAVMRLGSLSLVPIEPSRGDMLPLVQQALGTLLRGESPYTTYAMPWELPLTYLPVTWLAYLPPFLLGGDIRLTNLVAELVTGGVLVWLAVVLHQTKTGEGWRASLRSVWHEEQGMVLWAWMFLQPSVLHWFQVTTAPVWWALLSITLALLIAGRHGLAAGVLGLCAAASPMTAVAAPFVVLCWLRAAGWRRTVVWCGVAGLVAVAIIGPFLLWSPRQFLLGTWQWFNDNQMFPRLKWETERTWAIMPGLSGLFWRSGLVGVLKPLQSLLLLSLLLLFWRAQAAVGRLAPFVAAAFLLFMVLNPVLWPYLYNPALIASLLAVVALGRYHRRRGIP